MARRSRRSRIPARALVAAAAVVMIAAVYPGMLYPALLVLAGYLICWVSMTVRQHRRGADPRAARPGGPRARPSPSRGGR
jgi:hypothetical protein